MAASLSRLARGNRSLVNKAANRIVREEAAFNMAVAMVARRWRQREHERGRELLACEVEAMCDEFSFDDLVEHIRSNA